MRFFALMIALCAIPATAGAQSSDCRSIADSEQRLACYDMATPRAMQRTSKPVAAAARQKPAATEQQVTLGDTLELENSRLDAKIKGICRGC